MSTDTLNEVLQDQNIAVKAHEEARKLSEEAQAESAVEINSMNERLQSEVGVSQEKELVAAS
jgi:hypothetical protein